MLAPYAFEGISTWLQRLDRFAQVIEPTERRPMNPTTVTTPKRTQNGAKGGFARVDARPTSRTEEVVRNG